MTIQDLLNLSDQDIDNMQSLTEIKAYIKKGAEFATQRRDRALKALERNPNMPIPSAYKDWGEKPEFYKTKEGNVKSKWKNIGKDKFKSWRTIDFKDSSGYSSYQEQLKTIVRFLSTKTSRIEDWKKSLTNFKDRLGIRMNMSISNDVFNEFWRIAGMAVELSSGTDFRYKTTKNETYYKSYTSITKELQQLVWEEMQKDKFTERYNEKQTPSNDEYAQRILNKIANRINEDYEKKEMNEYELESDFSSSMKLTRRGL